MPSTPARQRRKAGVSVKARGKQRLLGLAGGKSHTSDRQALLPGLIGCLRVSLEPQLSLGMDLIAVGFHRGEGLHRDILDGEQHKVRVCQTEGPCPLMALTLQE